ncbi:MAG: hypothetical protein ACREIA_16205 [Opitutaceae bacterium]
MNSTLSCRIARLRAAFTGKPSAHTETCASCQAWFAAEAALDEQLARESRPLTRRPAPEGIEQLVMAGIRARQQSARNSTRRSAPRRRGLVFGSALAATAAAVAVIFLARDPAPSPDSEYNMAAAETWQPEEVAAMVASVEAIPGRLRATLVPSATRLANANPLMNEVDSVYADARSALDFLALNFLPSDTAASDKKQG